MGHHFVPQLWLRIYRTNGLGRVCLPVATLRRPIMGATGWSYIVPYQADAGKVLRDLHGDVFRRGEYEKPHTDVSFLEQFGFFEADDEERERMMTEFGLEPLRKPIEQVGLDGLRGWLAERDTAPDIGSLEELEALRCLSHSGTGSILDIVSVAAEPAPHSLFPLGEPRLRDVFGTDRPTRSQVDAWRRRDGSVGEPTLYERGQGIYFVIYEDGRPMEIYIEGASGD